jgi:hypothetical protein
LASVGLGDAMQVQASTELVPGVETVAAGEDVAAPSQLSEFAAFVATTLAVVAISCLTVAMSLS